MSSLSPVSLCILLKYCSQIYMSKWINSFLDCYTRYIFFLVFFAFGKMQVFPIFSFLYLVAVYTWQLFFSSFLLFAKNHLEMKFNSGQIFFNLLPPFTKLSKQPKLKWSQEVHVFTRFFFFARIFSLPYVGSTTTKDLGWRGYVWSADL